MNEFNAPIDDICFALKHSARVADLAALPDFEHFDPEVLRDLLTESGRFMAEVVSPLNRIGDFSNRIDNFLFAAIIESNHQGYSRIVFGEILSLCNQLNNFIIEIIVAANNTHANTLLM